MGTRGAFGFRLNGQDKVMYNHFDSYPGGLGNDVVKWLYGKLKKSGELLSVASDAYQSNNPDAGRKIMGEALGGVVEQVANIKLIADSQAVASSEDWDRLGQFSDNTVGTTGTWYQLLRMCQPGEDNGIENTLKAGAMIDADDFLHDSLFCEYAYIVNFDDMTFETYKGFQKKKHNQGRYFDGLPDKEYYGVALTHAFPLYDIKNWYKTYQKIAYPKEDGDDDEDYGDGEGVE